MILLVVTLDKSWVKIFKIRDTFCIVCVCVFVFMWDTPDDGPKKARNM
jgi:hypothetical protein